MDDFIYFSTPLDIVISDKIVELYESGLTPRQIAKETGYSKTTVRSHLLQNKISLKPSINSHAGQKIRKNYKLSGVPPYGFLFYKNKLVVHPEQVSTFIKIIELWKKDIPLREIARRLDSINAPSKNGKGWNHFTVTSIIKRHQKCSDLMKLAKKWFKKN